jgi:hypothetical protein
MTRVTLTIAFSVIFAGQALAQGTSESRPALTLGTEVVASSQYIWRGFQEGGFSVQPNTWLEFGGVRASTWFNLSEVPTEPAKLTERNFSLKYGRRVGSYDVSGGWIGYFFTNHRGHSHEGFVAIKREGRLSPSAVVYHDFRLGRGTYIQASAAHRLADLLPGLDLSSSVGVGYNHHHWTEHSGLSDANFGAKATWRHGRLAVGPFINHSRSLNESIVPTRTYGGIEVAVR